MKVLLMPALLAISFSSLAQRCPENWKPWEWDLATITIKICIQPDLTMGQQSVFWGVQNKTQDKLHVVFEKVTTLTCGNVKVRKASIYLKAGEFLGGGHFSGDLDLADAFFSEDCDAKLRIRTVNYRALKIENLSANERAKEAQQEANERKQEAERQQAQAARAAEERRQQIESQNNVMAQQRKSMSDENAKARLAQTNANFYQQNLNSLNQLQNVGSKISTNDADPIISALTQQLANLSKSTGTGSYTPSTLTIGTNNYLNSTSQNALTDNVTTLATGVVGLLDMGARNKQLKLEQENLRQAEAAAEREQQRQLLLIETERLDRIKAEQDLAKSRLYSFFGLTRIPNASLALDSIYFVVMQNSGNRIVISETPVKVFKTLDEDWPTEYLIKRFSGATTSEGVSTIRLSGYYMDILSAEVALNQMIKVAPMTGFEVSVADWSFDNLAMNEYIKEEKIKAIRLERMAQVQLRIDTLINSLEQFTYPNFGTKEDSLSYFMISYTNSSDSLYLSISNQITLRRYSDKSWPLKSDFWNKIKSSFNEKKYEKNLLIGAYNTSECVDIMNMIKRFFAAFGVGINDMQIKTEMSKQKMLTKEFWDEN